MRFLVTSAGCLGPQLRNVPWVELCKARARRRRAGYGIACRCSSHKPAAMRWLPPSLPPSFSAAAFSFLLFYPLISRKLQRRPRGERGESSKGRRGRGRRRRRRRWKYHIMTFPPPPLLPHFSQWRGRRGGDSAVMKMDMLPTRARMRRTDRKASK